MEQSARPVVGALHTSACNTRNTSSSSSSGIDTTHHDHQPQQTPPAATTTNTSSGNTRSSTHTSGSPPLSLRACQCMWHRPLAVWCTRGVVLFQQCSSPSCLQGTAPVHFFCAHITAGLFRELSPGPLAPEARIMPLDQTAIDGVLLRRARLGTKCATSGGGPAHKRLQHQEHQQQQQQRH